jgi:hypothetical protein
MDARDAEVVADVVAQVRATLQAAAPAWRRAHVRFELLGGCFSTRVLVDDGPAGDRLAPLDAARHRTLFVRLQAMGRPLCAADGRQAAACDVEIDPRTHCATRSAPA